jgi:hypothetical protein
MARATGVSPTAAQRQKRVVALPRRSGFDDDDMERWRAGFETEDPDAHDAFLRSLGLAQEEMKAIRQRAASG